MKITVDISPHLYNQLDDRWEDMGFMDIQHLMDDAMCYGAEHFLKLQLAKEAKDRSGVIWRKDDAEN